MKILVVEDEVDSQRVFSSLLDILDVQADAVTTAEEGLQQLEHEEYDGVIIDLALPGMDGFGLLDEIRGSSQHSNLTCIAVTAFHSSEVKKQAMEAGFNAYFSKPISTRNFAQDVLDVIQNG